MKEHTKLILAEEEKLWQEYVTKRDTLGADHKETLHAFALYNLMLEIKLILLEQLLTAMLR